VVPNKATRAGYQDPGFSRHAELPFVRLKREDSILSDGEDGGQAK
jgi:deoxycytidine triphosphate deaminase